jgi:hypothetical protein
MPSYHLTHIDNRRTPNFHRKMLRGYSDFGFAKAESNRNQYFYTATRNFFSCLQINPVARRNNLTLEAVN